MVFSSTTFLFVFLPVVLLVYHGLVFLPIHLGSQSHKWIKLSNAFLLLVSVVFYYWGERHLVLLFIGTTAVDFVAALLISRAMSVTESGQLGRRTARQKALLATAIGVNLSILFLFKYFSFTAGAVNAVLKPLGLQVPAYQLTLPLGISFFIFHSMSYTIDVYRGQVSPTRSFIDYACYVLMFPQLVAGPIVRFSYVAKALVWRTVSAAYFARGVSQFIIGLSKKVLIANIVGDATDRIFVLRPDRLTPASAWRAVWAYTIQIYFDFSGYSDMAIGLGRMFGFELPLNFDYPYTARSIREFWRRWHISLSTWFRDYLYIPLGGSQGSQWKTARNLVVVFFLCGLWHGAKWTFVAWGLYHGFFLVLERNERVSSLLGRHAVIGRTYTVLTVAVGWLLFRADSFSQALAFLRAMAGLSSGRSYPIQWFLRPETIAALILGTALSAPTVPAIAAWLDRTLRAMRVGSHYWTPAVSGLQVAALTSLLAVCAIQVVAGTYNPFIYFRF
ncbi:MAG TPA: MBOAT family O-acyltransferase [Bryobacteraceae bacterium]|nr:MBOAT family O-acyltransferase [Bryobacteraceae bacterium]